MQRLLEALLRSGSFFVFAFLELICFYLIVNFNSQQQAIWAETLSVYLGGYNDWAARRQDYFDLDEQNEVLRRKNAELLGRLESAAYDSAADRDSIRDDTRLQRFNFLTARVVNRSPYGPNNTMVINRGRDLQVMAGQGVVDGNGIVGIVSSVTPRHARLLSVLHLDIRVSAGLDNGAFGTLRWDGRDPRRMTVTDVPAYVGVSPGDTLYTTGFSNVFPTDYPIATVAGSRELPGTGSQELEAVLLNDPLRVRTVYVVQDLFKEELDYLNRSR